MNRTATSLAIGAMLLAPSLSLAASLQLSPAQASVAAGQTFTVQVVATPSGSSLYTASAHLSFDPSILEATNFSFAPTWMPVTQSGYDSIDNTGGTLVKTAGFPGGFDAPTTLGTVTFEAKAAGNATITATGDSVLLDGGSVNELSGAQGSVSVTVTTPPAAATQNTFAQVPTPTGNTTTPPGSASTTSTTTAGNLGQTAGAASAIGTGTAQTAAAGSAFGGVPQWVWWLLLAIVVLGGGYWIWRTYFGRKA